VLAFCFCVRICHMFPISKCREESDLGLCTTSVLANKMPRCIGKIRQILRRNTFLIETRHPAAAFSGFLHVPKLCADLDPTLLYILIRCIMISGTHSKFLRKNKNTCAQRLLPATLLERWPHVCLVKITFGLLPMDCFVCTRTNSMKCLVNRNLLRIRVCLRNTQPHLKRNVFAFRECFIGVNRRGSCFRNPTIGIVLFKRHLHYMRP